MGPKVYASVGNTSVSFEYTWIPVIKMLLYVIVRDKEYHISIYRFGIRMYSIAAEMLMS